MSWTEEMAELRAWVRGWVEQKLTTMFISTTLSNSSALGDSDAMTLADDTKGQRPVVRHEPYGHRSRPTTDVRVFGIRFGSSNVVFLGIGPTQKYGPQDLEMGEVAIYSEQIVKAMHLDKNGQNNINSKSGQDVVVNGGTAKVARVGDGSKIISALGGGALAKWMSQVEVAITNLGGTAPSPLANAFVADPGIVIKDGAAHFKG